MNKTLSSVLTALLVVGSGMVSSSSQAVVDETLALKEVYQKQLQVQLLKTQAANIESVLQKMPGVTESSNLADNREQLQANLKKISAQQLGLNSQIKKITAKLSAQTPLAGDDLLTRKTVFTYKQAWREVKERFLLHTLEPYRMTGSRPARVFPMDLTGTKTYVLALQNKAFSWKASELDPLREAQPHLKATIRCSTPFSFKGETMLKSYRAGETAKFRWYDSAVNSQAVALKLTRNDTECDLRFEKGNGVKYGIKLVPEAKRLGPALELATRAEACYLPDASALPKPERFFLNSRYLSMTCPEKTSPGQTLEDPQDGVAAKIEAMTGSPLSREAFRTANPFVKLDFSKAPKLDLIVVSYLVFRSDFYGNLMAQAIKYHASRGTAVRILISDVITKDQDRQLLHDLAANYPNVKLYEFRYDSSWQQDFGDHFDQLHRTMHVKIFATYSKTDESANSVVIGGRNIHDGFVFREAPDHSDYPGLVNYAGGDESFGHWRDFEAMFRGRSITETVLSHFFTLWTHDRRFDTRSINVNIPVAAKASMADFPANGESLVRHVISVPYKDDQMLVDFYADLIDSAEKTLLISTPYFRPTLKVAQALERAAKRNVDVTLVTRIDLDGDTADWFIKEVNKAGINQFWQKIKVYEYTEPKVILHSKLVMIDGRMTFLGSVNLNKRSFIHDMENGLLVYSPEFHQRMKAIYEQYMQTSRLIDEKQKIPLWIRPLLNLVDDKF